MILTGNVLPDQRIQVVHRPRIGLRSGHEGLDADVDGQPALHASEHVAGNHQLFLIGLVQVVPDAQARGARVREQDVAFGLLAVIDHDVDHVAGLHRDFAVGILKLLERNEAFGLVSEVDDHIFGGDREDRTLQNFVGGRRGEVAVIFEKILVILRDHLVHLPFVLVYGH